MRSYWIIHWWSERCIYTEWHHNTISYLILDETNKLFTGKFVSSLYAFKIVMIRTKYCQLRSLWDGNLWKISANVMSNIINTVKCTNYRKKLSTHTWTLCPHSLITFRYFPVVNIVAAMFARKPGIVSLRLYLWLQYLAVESWLRLSCTHNKTWNCKIKQLIIVQASWAKKNQSTFLRDLFSAMKNSPYGSSMIPS